MADVIELASRIERVCVFRSQALVTRWAEIEGGLAGGVLGVRLVGLPLMLRDDSVRVRLPGDTGARVVDMHLELRLGTRGGPLDTEAEEHLRGYLHELVGVEVERNREVDHVRLLESLAPAGYKTTDLPDSLAFEPRHQVETWMELGRFVREGLDAGRVHIRELERRMDELRDSIRDAVHQVEQGSQADAELIAVCRKAARLQIESPGESKGPLEVELSYLVPAARWLPEYELRVLPDRSQAEITLKALTAQRTGEDWRKVDLAFSTADLERSAALPELDSWRIGKAQPLQPSGWRELPDTVEELFDGYDRGLRTASPPVPGGGPGASRRSLPEMPDLEVEAGRNLARPRKRETERRMVEQLRQIVETRRDVPDLSLSDKEHAEAEPVVDELYDDNEYTPEAGVLMAAEEAAEPPPAPPAPQASFDRMEAPRRKASRSMLGAVASMVQGVKKKPKLRDATRESFALEEPAGALGGGAFGDDLDGFEVEAGIAASPDALAYTSLRMQGPGAPTARGQLKTQGMVEGLAGQLEPTAPKAATLLRSLSGADLASVWGVDAIDLSGLSLPMHAVSLEHSAGHFSVRYEKESPGEVLADGQLHALTVLNRPGDVERVFRCVPAEDTNVYQLALFANPLEVPLLAGPVRVYRGADFVVTAPLATTPPGKIIAVNLGVEEGIRVARNTHFKESTAGLLGGDTLLDHTVEIEVRSRLQHPARIEVFERVPVSHDEDIKVEVVETRPQADKYDQKDRSALVEGGQRFRLTLPPGEKTTCVLRYRIVIPSKQVLVGGNRRD